MKQLTRQELDYYSNRLNSGVVYMDRSHQEQVEFVYMGATGYAIVCEPGDSGGGMQSCWGVDPRELDSLDTVVEKLLHR